MEERSKEVFSAVNSKAAPGNAGTGTHLSGNPVNQDLVPGAGSLDHLGHRVTMQA